MQRLSKDIMIVESQLPELEEQKTTAVGGRDFKTAAKTSSKIKSLKGALEQSVIQRKELQDTVIKADAELKEARQQLSTMLQVRKEAERTIGEDILQSIQQCRQNCIIARERLSENQYRVHSLLSSEITSLENRIKYITMKFDISPDLIGELQRHSSKSSLRSVGRSASKEGEQSTATLDELESLLKKAVAEENYEEAGKIICTNVNLLLPLYVPNWLNYC
jgi:protein-arginine kinase activator protein McsA